LLRKLDFTLRTTRMPRLPFLLSTLGLLGFFVTCATVIDAPSTLPTAALLIPMAFAFVLLPIVRLNDAGYRDSGSTVSLVAAVMGALALLSDTQTVVESVGANALLYVAAAVGLAFLGLLAILPSKVRGIGSQATA